jgi:hypothetical protein
MAKKNNKFTLYRATYVLNVPCDNGVVRMPGEVTAVNVADLEEELADKAIGRTFLTEVVRTEELLDR